MNGRNGRKKRKAAQSDGGHGSDYPEPELAEEWGNSFVPVSLHERLCSPHRGLRLPLPVRASLGEGDGRATRYGGSGTNFRNY